MSRYLLLFAALVFGLPVFEHMEALAASTLPPDDPSLFEAFFQLNATQNSSPLKTDKVAAARQVADLAARLRIAPSEFPKVLAIASSHNRDAAGLKAEARAYLEKRKSENRMPDKETLRRFELKHHQLVQTSIERCRKELGPKSWEGLRSYINEVFRAQVVQTPVAP